MRYILLVLLAFVTTFASAQVQFLGSPTTTVRNRGNFVSDSLFYLPKRQKLPSDTGALRYQISDSALYVWTGSAWRSTGTAGSAITGSGVAGYMPEFTTSTNLDTTRLYHSAGRFGIGTTSPANELHVVGNIRLGASNAYQIGNDDKSFSITNRVTNTRALVIDTANSIFFGTLTTANGAGSTLSVNMQNSSVNVDNTLNVTDTATFSGRGLFNDRVGIGTSAPARLLHVNGTNGRVRITGGNHGLEFDDGRTGFLSGGTDIIHIYTSGNVRGVFQADGEFLVNTNTDAGAYALQVAGSIYNTTGAVLAASSGNVGIGTASPVSKLDVQGAISSSANFRFNNNDFSQVAIRETGSGWIAGGYNLTLSGTTPVHAATGAASGYFWRDGNIAFWTNSSASANTNIPERMRIKDDGEVLIGTTSDAGAYALQVAGAIYNTTGGALAVSSGDVFIGGTSDAYADAGRKVLSLNGTSNSLFSMRSGGTSIGLLYANGTTSFDIVSNGKPITFNTSSALNQERLRIHSNGGLKFVGQADPPQAEAGTVYYDNDDNKLKVYNGTTWVDLH